MPGVVKYPGANPLYLAGVRTRLAQENKSLSRETSLSEKCVF